MYPETVAFIDSYTVKSCSLHREVRTTSTWRATQLRLFKDPDVGHVISQHPLS